MALSPESKTELIDRLSRRDFDGGSLCRRAHVSESTFRDWLDRFIAAGTAALHPNPKAKVHPDWTDLTQENGRLKTVADLSVEHLVLKSTRWDLGSEGKVVTRPDPRGSDLYLFVSGSYSGRKDAGAINLLIDVRVVHSFPEARRYTHRGSQLMV